MSENKAKLKEFKWNLVDTCRPFEVMKLIMAEKNDQCETDQKRIYSFRLNWGLIFGFFLRWISIVTLKLRGKSSLAGKKTFVYNERKDCH